MAGAGSTYEATRCGALEIRPRRPRLRRCLTCLLRGHAWHMTSAPGYAFRCRRCHLLSA